MTKTLGQELVSAVVLARESESTLSGTLHSIYWQDYSKIEIIVCCYGRTASNREFINRVISSDANRAERSQIIWLDGGSSRTEAFTQALHETNGEYLIVLDDGDALESKEAISQFIKAFKSAPNDCLAIAGRTYYYTDDFNTKVDESPSAMDSSILQSSDTERFVKVLSERQPIPLASICWKRYVFDRYQTPDGHYKLLIGYPLLLRMAFDGQMPTYVDEVVVRRKRSLSFDLLEPFNGDIDLFNQMRADWERMWKCEYDSHWKSIPLSTRRKNMDMRNIKIWQCMSIDGSQVFAKRVGVLTRLELFLFSRPLHRTLASAILATISALCSWCLFNPIINMPLLGYIAVIGSLACLIACCWFGFRALCFFARKAKRRMSKRS